jgi:Amt family ammonium transporter
MKRTWGACAALAAALSPAFAGAQGVDSGATAWMLTSTALVLMMTLPGLALFYGGLVRTRNVLSVLMQCFALCCVISLIWVAFGYSLVFDAGNALIGGLSKAWLRGVEVETVAGAIPETVFAMFQLTFAIITPALIIGGFAERTRFAGMLWFSILWLVVVYFPVAHWVWAPDGWLFEMGFRDFAGGAVVHVNAAAAALVAAVVVGPRKDYGRHAILPHNVPFTLLGAGVLWFGWFGFNAGSALSASPAAALAFTNTLLAPAATLATWTLVDLARGGRVTAIGAATAIVVGLVVITPAAGFVGPAAAMAMGALGAVPSYVALIYRARTKLDDSLDVVAAHGTGGATGAVLTGVFADPAWSGGPSGLLAGNPGQVFVQIYSVAVVLAYSGVATFVILKLVGLAMPLRISGRVEGVGLDVAEHGEEAYTTGDGAILVSPGDAAAARRLSDVVALQNGGHL